VSVLWRNDPGYPVLLAAIADPPARLFVRGVLPVGPTVAVVGSRQGTPYGQRAAHQLAEDLSNQGIIVVSGLARGIDRAAHEGALTGPTPTVAVLASGLDPIYPPEHVELADRIAVTGALLSEAEDGSLPLPSRVTVNNRIISGLSLGVIIVEAAERSGALITARLALEQGREVFCVPGSIENPLTLGPHSLVKDGATLVRTVEDVLAELPEAVRAYARAHARAPAPARADSGPQEPELAAVWELLDWVEPRHHDELAEQLRLDVIEVSRRLTLLEMGNYIIGDRGAVTRSRRRLDK